MRKAKKTDYPFRELSIPLHVSPDLVKPITENIEYWTARMKADLLNDMYGDVGGKK